MRIITKSLTLSLPLFLTLVHAQNVTNTCPTTDYACLDVINSSLCLSQTATANVTRDAMAECVEYPGSASNLTGGAKVRKRRRGKMDGGQKLMNVKINSFVNARGVRRRLLMMWLRACSRHLVGDTKDRVWEEELNVFEDSRKKKGLVFAFLKK